MCSSDEQTCLPTTYVEHLQRIVESYDRWNDALCLLHSSSGLYEYTHFDPRLLYGH